MHPKLQVGEFGLATRRWYAVRVKHRQRRGNSAKGAVGMPKTVAELIETARVIGDPRPVVLVEVRDI